MLAQGRRQGWLRPPRLATCHGTVRGTLAGGRLGLGLGFGAGDSPGSPRRRRLVSSSSRLSAGHAAAAAGGASFHWQVGPGARRPPLDAAQSKKPWFSFRLLVGSLDAAVTVTVTANAGAMMILRDAGDPPPAAWCYKYVTVA